MLASEHVSASHWWPWTYNTSELAITTIILDVLSDCADAAFMHQDIRILKFRSSTNLYLHAVLLMVEDLF